MLCQQQAKIKPCKYIPLYVSLYKEPEIHKFKNNQSGWKSAKCNKILAPKLQI